MTLPTRTSVPRPTSTGRTAPGRHRHTRWAYAAGAVLAFCALAARADAQVDATLRDADAPGFIGALRADIARNLVQARATATIGREIQAGIDATIATSQEDPLAYVRARTARFVLPPDARYAEACSRAMSAVMLKPFAVYAVGKPADDVAAGLQGRDPRSLTNKEIYALIVAQTNSSAGRAFDATIRFYRAHGFATVGTVDSKASFRWKGAAPDPLALTVYLTNVGAETAWRSCEQLGNTALLSLTIAEDRGFSKTSSATTAAQTSMAEADAAFASALTRAGMTQDRYAALLNAAWQALRETDEPAEAEQTDAMSRIPRLRALAEARRQNRAWMERHRDELRPLLEAYGRSLESRPGT